MNYPAQRLRNLTTGRLHTKMEDIYKDIETITDSPGIMTHHLPAANKAIQPYLRKYVADERFWDGEFDTEHEDTVEVPTMSDAEKHEFFERFDDELMAFWQKVGNK